MLKKLAILGAVTAGATLALPDPAQAILYNVSGNLAAGGTVTGTFEFDGATYNSWNLNVAGSPAPNLNRVYDSSNGSVLTSTVSGANQLPGNGGLSSTSSLLSVSFPGSTFTGASNTFGYYLVLAFSPALSSSQSNLVQGNTVNFTGSYIRQISVDNAGQSISGEASISNGTATPVPLETDALPILGSAAFMAGGLWFKRRRT
ncbi:MAG: hypothetical protein GC158_16645 [Cyanobacteria bacterium RI_101]|nr:hypothetical protein [Cyanobacteria bacterium RI_101]